jgi:hypothetical protein
VTRRAAGRLESAALAGEGDEEVALTGVAVKTEESVVPVALLSGSDTRTWRARERRAPAAEGSYRTRWGTAWEGSVLVLSRRKQRNRK